MTVTRPKRVRKPRPPALVSLKEACEVIGLHPNSAYKYRRKGSFPIEIIELGDRYFCRIADLEAFTGHALDAG